MQPSKVNYGLVNDSETLVKKKTGPGIAKAHKDKNLCHPGEISQTQMLRVQLQACEVLQGTFDMIDLSPVCILGTNSVLADISQKTVLSTLREVEVVADPTTALALESVRRKSQGSKNDETLRLASCIRTLRLQSFQNNPGFSNHFLALGMISLGLDIGHRAFEIQELRTHIRGSLRVVSDLKEASLSKVTVYFSDTRIMHAICKSVGVDISTISPMSRQSGFSAFNHLNVTLPRYVSSPGQIVDRAKYGTEFDRAMNEIDFFWNSAIKVLSEQFPSVEFVLHLDRLAGINYYNGPCFKLRAQNSKGEVYPLVDGGRVDWAKKLTGSKKDRMFSTGIGLELLEKQFG